MSRKFKIALVAGIVVVGYVVSKTLLTPKPKKEEKKAAPLDPDFFVPVTKRPN